MFFENGNFSHPNLQPTPPQFAANNFLPETCPPYFDDSSLQESPPSTSLPPEDRGTEFFAWPKAGDLHEKTRPEFDDAWQKKKNGDLDIKVAVPNCYPNFEPDTKKI